MANHTELNPEKALIWRIVHRDNLPWILDHGLHCGNSAIKASDWISIGNPDLTQDRETRTVPLAPGGNLNDYVPFYFTPFSVMMRNIQTGWGGVRKRPNEEIVILVSSLRHVQALGLPFLFTDAHAYYRYTTFYSGLADLDKIDWPSLQAQDFRRDPDNPMKFERYQAEALIHQHLPVAGLLGIVCYTLALQASISAEIVSRSLKLKAIARTGLYIR